MFKLDIKKLDYRGKIFLTFGILILVMAAILVFIDIPAVKNIKKMKDEIEFQRVDLEKKYVKSQRLKKMVLSVGKIETEIARLNNIFVNENRQLEFITRLESTAQKNSLVQEINLSKADTGTNGYKNSNLYIKASGNFDNLVNYLADLEAFEYYVNISDMELVSGQKDGEYDLNLKAITYWR